jgi:hypothetical protein
MTEGNDRLQKISNEFREHIIAVKGALELIDASLTDNELSDLIEKSIHRMDTLQRLTDDMIIALKQCFERIQETKASRKET